MQCREPMAAVAESINKLGLSISVPPPAAQLVASRVQISCFIYARNPELGGERNLWWDLEGLLSTYLLLKKDVEVWMGVKGDSDKVLYGRVYGWSW